MKTATFAVIVLLFSPLAFGASDSKTYTGIITDTMCGSSHAAMNVTPDSRCVKECIGHGPTYKYALADGDNLYTLSDQETPAQFAGTKVKVTGVLYTKTNILKVESIVPAR